MFGPIPFEIPHRYAADIATGVIERYGTILKNVSDGRIVAHLQETGVCQQACNQLMGSALDVASPISAFSSLGANFQLFEVKKMLEGMQMLGFVNLAATVAGIGVSAAGFAIMNRRFNQIESLLNGLGEEIREGFDKLHWQLYRSRFSALHACMDKADQLSYTRASARDWQGLALELTEESRFFQGEIEYLLNAKSFDAGLLKSLAAAYGMANGARIQMLVQSGDLHAARRVAEDLAEASRSIFDDITPTDLATRLLLTRQEQKHWTADELRTVQLEMDDLVQGMREAQDVAHSRPLLIDTLIVEGIEGPEYLRVLREEKEQPFLLLPAA